MSEPKVNPKRNSIFTIIIILLVFLGVILFVFYLMVFPPGFIITSTPTFIPSPTFTEISATNTRYPTKTPENTRTPIPPPTRRPTATLDISLLTPPSPMATMPRVKQIPLSGYRYPTAICNDGSYSYSLSRSGTCSHHGGVFAWFK